MKDTIFYVGGGKGGVGKSMVTIALVQFLIDKYGDHKTIHLIETDGSNPDVGCMYKGHIPISTAILDESENGWIHMTGLIEQSANTLFVINSSTRSVAGIQKNGRNFSAVLESGKLPYNLVTFWPINRQLDCVNLLMDYMRSIHYGPVFTIRNTYWGNPEDFLLYDSIINEAKDKEPVRSRINGVLDFPRLNDRITPKFFSYGKTIPEAAEMLNIFMRPVFSLWKNRAYEMFESTGLFDEPARKQNVS